MENKLIILICEREVEHADVLLDVVVACGTGYYGKALLYVPADDNLCRSLAMRLGYLLDGGVFEQGAIRHLAAKREPALELYVVLFGLLLPFLALRIRVALNLHHGRLYLGKLHDVVEERVGSVEVADAERAHLTLLYSLLHIAPCTTIVAHRLVDIKQVNIVGLQAFEHLVDSIHCLALAILRWPQLARNPNLAARYATFLYRFAHSALHTVGMGGVDVAVAAFEGVAHGILCYAVAWHIVSTDTKPWHPLAVVELHVWDAVDKFL